MKNLNSSEKNIKYLKFEAELKYLLYELKEKATIEDFILVDELKQSIIIFALKDEFEERNEVFLENTKNDFYENIKKLKYNHSDINTSSIESFMEEFYFDKFNRDAQSDTRPAYGEYFEPRGIGYDLSGFIKSKEAGERILEMVKQVLNKEKVDSWLDYRPDEPKWIQFKIQDHEFNIKKLEKLVIDNGNILTKEILIECKL